MVDQVRIELDSLVLECKWEPSGIKRRVGTTLSKMIKFRGEPLFRAGLKNLKSSSTLLFMTFDAIKMGINDINVFITSENTNQIMDRNMISAQRRVHLYTFSFPDVLEGNHWFTFELHVNSKDLNYPLQRFDNLLGQQMWKAAINQAGTDYELIAQGRRFFVHKFVLAARSSVFAALFAANGAEVGEVRSQRLKTTFGDESCLEQFLKFVYTGELEGAVSHHLKELAETYEVYTLLLLCKSALLPGENLDEDHADLAMVLKTNTTMTVPHITPNSDSEFLSKSASFTITWDIPLDNLETPLLVERNSDAQSFVLRTFGFDSENIFSAKITLDKRRKCVTIYFLVHYPAKCGCRVEEVECCAPAEETENSYLIASPMMESSIQMFAVTLTKPFQAFPKDVQFFVKLSSTVPNYDYKFRDLSFEEDLWGAARSLKLTDFVFLVGSTSFPAHRPLLASRSPVLSAMLSSDLEEARTGRVQISDCDPETFALFLRFLYVGELEGNEEKVVISGPMKIKLFALADKYQVETLMKICQTPTGSTDLEETINAFLSC